MQSFDFVLFFYGFLLGDGGSGFELGLFFFFYLGQLEKHLSHV